MVPPLSLTTTICDSADVSTDAPKVAFLFQGSERDASRQRVYDAVFAPLHTTHIRHAFEVIMQRAHVITGHLCARQLYTNPRYRFSSYGTGAA